MDTVANNLQKIPVVSHTSASGTLVLGASGAAFPAAPFRLTAIKGSTYGVPGSESLTIFGVAAVAVNSPFSGQCTLTVTVLEGTSDQSYSSSDFAEMRLTAGTIADLNTAVTALQGLFPVANASLTNDSITVVAGSNMTGGGTVALGGSVTLNATGGGGGGSGTVTSVSVATANGVSGSVATATTTPALTLALGAITPSSVAATGTVAGSNLSGSNTGDQTITLTGAVTGTGTGSFATTLATAAVGTGNLAAAAVTYAKIQSESAATLLGNPTGSGASPSEITLGSGLSFAGSVLEVTAGGVGTVTAVSVVTANGLAGTVATSTTTPAITLETTITGVLKGNGTAISAATAGTDYVVPAGNITGTAAGLSASIAESQVTGLSADLAARLIAANNLSDVASAATARTNLGLGSLSVLSALPNPSASTLGGVESYASVSHQWINAVSTSGVHSSTQPAFTDLSGTAGIGQGGTGLTGTPTNGQLAIGNGSGFTLATLTAGTNVTITNASGAITIAASGGGGGSPGGSSGQVQFNSSSSFGGAADIQVGSNGQLNLAPISNASSPVAGDTWFDSTQLCHVHYGGSGTSGDCLNAYRVGLIYAQATNVTVTGPGATTLLSATGAVGSSSLPAGFLNVLGRTLRLRARGYVTSGASSPGTIVLSMKLGSNVIAVTGASTFSTSQTNRPWTADLDVCVKAVGTSGKLDCSGMVTIQNTANSGIMLGLCTASSGSQAPQTQFPIDLTQAYSSDCQVNMSATVNSFVLTNLTLEVLG